MRRRSNVFCVVYFCRSMYNVMYNTNTYILIHMYPYIHDIFLSSFGEGGSGSVIGIRANIHQLVPTKDKKVQLPFSPG